MKGPILARIFRVKKIEHEGRGSAVAIGVDGLALRVVR
ncbi:MAG: hypothetical protein RL077_5089 [Verrucomicrobiota bacterium]|jgi:hypothetical protein